MLADAVRSFFAHNGVPPCRIVAAVSGGVDSTALLLALCDLRGDGFEIVPAHVNHHLRGSESDADEAFVRAICAGQGVEPRIVDGTLQESSVRQLGIEGAARQQRTAALLRIREEEDALFIATAHQRNDQAETIVMRLLSGTGLRGLRGIHPVRADGFVRPLLDVSRAEIERELEARNVVPRQDRSNDDPRFLRNRVRLMLRSCTAGEIERIASIAREARDAWIAMELAVDAAAGVEETAASVTFRTWPAGAAMRRALLRRHIDRLDPHARDVSADDLRRLAVPLEQIRRTSVTKHLELERRGAEVVLHRVGEPVAPYELRLEVGAALPVPAAGVSLLVEAGAGEGQAFQLPAGASPEFVVRSRRHGDRFRPLGLGGSRKLKDVFIDRKIAREERDRIPLLVWNGEIIWIAGLAISDSVRIRDENGDRYRVRVIGSSCASS